MRRHGARAGADDSGVLLGTRFLRGTGGALFSLFVLLALVLFAAWLALYRVFDHIHAARDHGHAHTAQDLKRLAGDGRHVHVAYAGS